jgi:hypothetical protein
MRHSLRVALGTGVLLLLLAFHRPIRAPIVMKLNDFFNLATHHHLSCECEADRSCVHKAQYLSPDVLLSRPYPPSHPPNASVPKLIHQSSSSNQMPPPDVPFWSETWRLNHPNWEWVLWRDEDNQRLVDLHFPWFKDAYAQLDTADSRVAAARYLYMYAFGGYFPNPRVNSLILQEFTQTLISSVCVPSILFSSNTLHRHFRSILQSRSQVSLQFTNSRTWDISASIYIGKSSFRMHGWHPPRTTLSSSCHSKHWIATRLILRSILIGFDD